MHVALGSAQSMAPPSGTAHVQANSPLSQSNTSIGLTSNSVHALAPPHSRRTIEATEEVPNISEDESKDCLLNNDVEVNPRDPRRFLRRRIHAATRMHEATVSSPKISSSLAPPTDAARAKSPAPDAPRLTSDLSSM